MCVQRNEGNSGHTPAPKAVTVLKMDMPECQAKEAPSWAWATERGLKEIGPGAGPSCWRELEREGMGLPEVTERPRKARCKGGEPPNTHTHSKRCGGLASPEVCGPPLQLVAVLLGGPGAGSKRNRTMEPLNTPFWHQQGLRLPWKCLDHSRLGFLPFQQGSC